MRLRPEKAEGANRIWVKSTMTTLLVIDDDRLHCDLLQVALSRHGYQVSTATSGRWGVIFRQLRPVVTLLDLRMPEMDGLAVLKRFGRMTRVPE